MKRKLLLLAFVVTMALPAFAQRIVESTEEFVSYDRNSISVIVTKYNDQYDNTVYSTVSGFSYGSKFDVNDISTKTITVRQNRTLPEGTASGWGYTPDEATVYAVAAELNRNNVGKEILNYILSPDSQGRFSRELIEARGQWNADDKDYIESQATQVNSMGQNGEKLIENSYIIVFDLKNPERVETKAQDKNGRVYTIVTWRGNVGAMVYKIADAKELVANVLNNMWIYEHDSASTADAKKRAFEELKVRMELVGTAGVSTSGKELSNVINNAKDQIIQKLEDQIPAWQVTIDCETIKPFITAKIGTKEGVRNGQRYGIYGQVYNRSNDCLEFKRKGYLRATVIADNRRVADGKADSTYFYRISGTASLNGTEILKQRNDLGLGISVNYNYNGSNLAPTKTRTFGSFSMIDVGLDYLAYIQKRGFSHYVMLGLGLDRFSGDNLYKGQKEFGKYGMALDSQGQPLFNNGASYTNVYIGYMFGIKIKQFVEIQPFLRGGIDMVSASTTVELDETTLKALSAMEDYTIKSESDLKKTSNAYYLDPGIRLTLNLIYPVQVFVQANYSILLTGGDKYNIMNNYFKDCGYGHSNGLGVGGGLRLIL
ncbi:MAG: hypothetical protein IJT45_07545 [Bacteroidales bacterium]|nr:hypothetical protein [Bacteroidales bacterium]